VGGSPLLPVYEGEISGRLLGVAADAFDPQGEPLVDELGELVITKPMPSMPVELWGDADGSLYRGSYFELFPGVWRQGDWIRFSERGSCDVTGRSDATLNRGGVRLGTSELYGVVEGMPEIQDSLVIGLELPGGHYWMPLFVVLADGVTLDDELVAKIRTTIREALSQRHVPDAIIAAPAIPRTLTGKKMEVPVKRLFQGRALAEVAAPGATADPAALDWFARFATERAAAEG
jgi:acetoacetyl-CoA synthetase